MQEEKTFLPRIIHHKQNGFAKDHYIGETGPLILYFMDFSLKENNPGFMIFIDFHKTLGSFYWTFLFSCPEGFQISPVFIQRVKKLSNNIQSCVLIEGLATHY